MKVNAPDQPVPGPRPDLEIVPAVLGGKRSLIVRDGLGLIVEPVVLQGDALLLFSLIDGLRGVRDIQLELVRRKGGAIVSADGIRKLLAEFDAVRLLDSPGFRTAQDEVQRAYLAEPVRTAALAGSAYPADPGRLRAVLDGILDAGSVPDREEPGAGLRVLAAPHIDFEAGRTAYGKAYRSLGLRPPRTVFLLGTGHQLAGAYFCLTEKDFETPLGRVGTDRRLVGSLREAGGSAVSGWDIAHRREHSLELQLLFLQHLFGSLFSLVPVLCGSFREDLERVRRAGELPGVGSFLGRLREAVSEADAEAVVVAGVDLSHIGPKFGHDRTAASLLPEAEAHDRALLDALCRGDAEAFWAASRRTGDRTNVCGFSTLACLLELFPGLHGTLLNYGVWREEATRSAVSFAAVSLRTA